MNKTKMILAGIGGAIGLVVLVLAFLVWQAFSAKSAALEGDDEEGVDGLETVESRAQTLSRKPVYPCKESLSAIEENLAIVEDWSKDGLALAARGDKVFDATTPPKFKTFLVSDAKRIAELPGGAAGKLVRPDFAFGPFKDYISGGKMPAEAELAELQRKWDDVATVAGILSKCGASELVDVQFAEKAPETTGVQDKRDARGRGDKRRGSSRSNNQAIKPSSNSFSYIFTFLVRPPAFVRTVNELAASERFITVDAFTFDRESDAIAEALGGDEKKDAAVSGTRRGRRGRRGNAEAVSRPLEEAGASVQKNGIITDPLLDAPFKAVMTVSVHDFRSLEEGNEADAEEKGAAK